MSFWANCSEHESITSSGQRTLPDWQHVESHHRKLRNFSHIKIQFWLNSRASSRQSSILNNAFWRSKKSSPVCGAKHVTTQRLHAKNFTFRHFERWTKEAYEWMREQWPMNELNGLFVFMLWLRARTLNTHFSFAFIFNGFICKNTKRSLRLVESALLWFMIKRNYDIYLSFWCVRF